ncbi:hypothetical protein [Algoriphagus aquimarinus]|uniref:DUF4157 domain-containing protein n=1 Tax=Algoriphagus aquimarinus TaxID=237018 RepID=A0A1I1AH06_9BACT|nr:hypothetical protein [Algoriphagus aquimarinus]SFB36646.1 hypothetical protein SAMN04489723_10881 [Algoriphagus aquimarinus]
MGNLNETQLKKIQSSKSLKTRFESMQLLKVDRKNIHQVLKSSEEKSVKELDLTSKAILLRSQTGDFEEAFELASWSAKAKPTTRKTIVKSFLRNKQAPLLVHQIARMKRNEAGDMMADYFGEGGDIKDVAEWLSAAGKILKTGVVPDDTDGLWGWVKDTVGTVVDAVVGAINTVADAIAAAGKNLAEAVAKVVTWTQDKISDFVEAVLAAGKSVAQVLSEAVKKGTAAVNKFIQAVIEAGKKGLEVLNWAIGQAESILRTALSKLEQLLGSFTSLLMEVAKMAASRLNAIVKALISAGKRSIDFIARLNRFALSFAKRLVQELKKLGRSLGEIMSAVINQSRLIARVVIDALKELGNSIFNILRVVAHKTVQQLAVIIGAIKDLAISLGTLLNDIARFTAAQAKKLMQALRVIWTRMREVLEIIAQKSVSVIRTLITALIGTVNHWREVLKEIATNVRDAFREGLIKGLIEIGKSAVTLMIEATKLGGTIAALTFAILLDVFGSHRGLNASERAEAEKVFGVSIDLDRVKLTDASLAADLIMWMNKNRPFTTMYVINYKSGSTLPMDTLIHELTHVWQAVTSGGVYMIEALHSQFFGKGYNLSEADLIKADGRLLSLEREQQAVVVEEFWKAEFDGQRTKIPVDLLRPYAKQVHKSRFVIKPFRLSDFQLKTKLVFATN